MIKGYVERYNRAEREWERLGFIKHEPDGIYGREYVFYRTGWGGTAYYDTSEDTLSGLMYNLKRCYKGGWELYKNSHF